MSKPKKTLTERFKDYSGDCKFEEWDVELPMRNKTYCSKSIELDKARIAVRLLPLLDLEKIAYVVDKPIEWVESVARDNEWFRD